MPVQFPEFTVERMTTYGINFDPRTNVIPSAYAKESWAPCYELKFFLEDWEGGPVIDGVLYPSAKGYFSCCKPMQQKKYAGPFSCYILDISTQDPQLINALNTLPVYAHHAEMDTILDIHKKMVSVDTRNTLDAKLEILSHACSILRLLLKPQYAVEHTYEGNPRRHQAALVAAREYLKAHPEEDVDLEKLAKDSHLHPTYFHKLFTAAFGRTPTEQLMWYRMTAAQYYLYDDNCSISEIARKCGFSSQSYFCRKFKQYTWQTPSQYRASLRRRRKKENE